MSRNKTNALRILGTVLLAGTAWLAPVLLRAEDEISQPALPETAPVKSEGVPGSAAPTEKAPPAARPTAQPQFTLPEVVITGDNQLTIGAQRLDRREDDVTMGSRELRGLSRTGDELPGLDKARTGTEALSPEAPRDTVAALHLGGGIKESLEGWALLGHQVKRFRALLHGFGEKFGGEEVAGSKTAAESAGWGMVLQADPSNKTSLRFSREYSRDKNDMAWHPIQEKRGRIDLDGEARWRFAPSWQSFVRGRFLDTRVTGTDGVIVGGESHAREREGKLRVQWDGSGQFAQGLWCEAGGRMSRGDFGASAFSSYDVLWGRTGVKFQPMRRLSLEAAIGAKKFNGLDVAGRGEPSVDANITLSENTHLKGHWRRELTLPTYQEVQGSAAHTSIAGGLPVPGFVKDDVGGELSRRMADRITLVLGGRAWREENHLQWSEPVPGVHLQVLEPLRSLKAWEGHAGLEADLPGRLTLRGDYYTSEAENESGDGLLVTMWPRHRGTVSLGRTGKKTQAKLVGQGVARREGSSGYDVPLPAYALLGLEVQYKMSKALTAWVLGDNLTGTKVELRPGYPEPRYHLRAGLEVVF